MGYEESYKSCMDAHRIQRKLATVRERTAVTEKRYSLTDLDKAMDLVIAGRPTATGVNVTANTALSCVPYLAGLRLIAETTGQLPLIEYKRLNPRGKERATDRRLYYLLHDEPNPEMDAMSFKSALTGHCVGWGNAFAEIEWDMDSGAPRALWPLRPDKMKVGRDANTKELFYLYTLPDGTISKLPAWRVWHMPGFSFDGIIGYDTVYLAREALGLSMALEEYGARFFGNGANPGGVLEHPHKLSKPAQDNLRTSWNEMHQGLSNQHRIAILEEGMSYKQIGIPPENAQFLESQKFSVIQIARLLNVKPHLLMDLERATFSNIEQQGIEHIQYTMMPWFMRWQHTCYRKLLIPSEKYIYFFEYLVDALLRGDSASRSNFYRQLFYMGTMSPNDIREKENMNPIPDPMGDKYYIQSNMIPLDKAGLLPSGNQSQQNPDDQDNAREASLQFTVRQIAEREKATILKQYRKNPEGFEGWLKDYYRDFPEYIQRQVEPLLGEKAKEFTRNYIDASQELLKGFNADSAADILNNWEDKRSRIKD